MKRHYQLYQRLEGNVSLLQKFALIADDEVGLMMRLGVLLADLKFEGEIVVMSGKTLAARLIGEQEWELYEPDPVHY